MRYAAIVILFSASLFASYDMNDVNNLSVDWLTDANRSDFNADNIVNFVDFAIMAADINLPSVPPEEPNTVIPIAHNINVSAMVGVGTWIALSSDSNDVQYKLLTLPAYGTLYDTLVGYDISTLQAMQFGTLKNMSSKRRAITSVPYTLANGGKWLYYYTSTIDDANFVYRVNNGISDSNNALASIDVIAFDANSVYFDGAGTITVPDNDAIEFDNSFSLSFWIKTQQPYAGIMKKRGESGAGFEISIEASRLKVSVWDSSGSRGDLRGSQNVATGDWLQCGIIGDSNGVKIYCGENVIGESNSLPAPLYANSSSLVIGRDSTRYLTGSIDRLSFWPAKMDDFSISVLMYFEERNGPGGGMFVPANYIARFNFDDKSGLTVVDSKAGLQGTINNAANVLWTPQEKPLYEFKPQFHIFNGGY